MSTEISGKSAVSGKKFIIIGGSSGIGFGVAKLVLKEGAEEVVIGSRSQSKVDDAVARLQSFGSPGSKVSGKTIDMSSIENVPAFFADLGHFDHLVFTAGGSLPKERFPDGIDLNVIRNGSNDRFWSVLRAIQISYKQINANGTITLTSGATTQKPAPGWTPLTGVVGAVEAATRNLAVDMAPIRVNCVSPGLVMTELFDGMSDKERSDLVGVYAKKLLTGRPATADEVAESYLYLFRCSYVTGQILYTEGGAFLI